MGESGIPPGHTCWDAGEERGPVDEIGTLSFTTSAAEGAIRGGQVCLNLLASALHDDFAGHLTYSPKHCPDVTVLDAEGPGQHVLFDVATARPMSDAHLGAAMMAPGAAAKKVEESKVATYGDVRPHHLIPFGVEV